MAAARLPLARAVQPRPDLPRRRPRRPGRAALAAADRRPRAVRGDARRPAAGARGGVRTGCTSGSDVLTLRDLIRDLDVKLHAGEAGLDRPVRWVHISELLDPTPWLSGGELLLTTGLQLTDERRSASTSTGSPATSSPAWASAPASTTRRVPAALVEAAEKRGFPLFEVPYEVPFIALTEKAFTHIVNEHYAVLQRAISAHERLERIVLSERGLDGVAAALSSLIGGPALIFDARGDVLARRAFKRELPDRDRRARVAAELRERLVSGHRRSYAPGGFESGAAGARAGAAGPAHPGRQRRAAGAAGLARGRQGRRPADRVRPPHAAPGRHRRGARAAAPARRRRHRAPPGRRRARRDGLRRPRAAPSSRAASSRSGSASASACSCSSRRGRCARPSRRR